MSIQFQQTHIIKGKNCHFDNYITIVNINDMISFRISTYFWKNKLHKK